MNYEQMLEQTQRGDPNAGVNEDNRRRMLTPEQREAEDNERAAWLAQQKAAREAERKAQRDAYEAEQNRLKEERNRAKEETAKAQAFALWEGSQEAFDRQWPGMYEGMLARETVERMERARRNHAELYRGVF